MKKYFKLITIVFATIILLISLCGCCIEQKESEVNFSVGDILFTDGTYIRAKDVKYGIPNNQIPKAMTVITATAKDGKALGVGIKKGENLKWAPKETTGYNTNFEKNQIIDKGSTNSGFTFSGDSDGSDNWKYICNIDSEGTQNAETNYPAFNFANNYGSQSGLTETDYESGWYLPSAAELYDVYKNREKVQKSLDAVKGFSIVKGFNQSYYWSSSQSIYFDNKAFQVNFSNGYVDDDYYKYHDVNVLVIRNFHIRDFDKFDYASPTITNINIPPATIGFTGEIPVTIIGKNLKGYEITCDYSEIVNIHYAGDEKVVVTIMCDGTPGEHKVNIKCGTVKKTGILKILSKKNCYEVADIILADGSKVSVNNLESYKIDENNKPIGVVVAALYGGTAGKIMGIKKSSALCWAPDKTAGMNNDFEEIITICSGDNKQGYFFDGDLDGSDNWDYICSLDPKDTQTPVANYPVFNYALNYGTTADLTGTDYESGWYVPSIAELHDLYTKIDIIQTSLTAAGGFVIAPSYDESYFWSSSVTSFSKYYAYQIKAYDGLIVEDYKASDNDNVLVFRDF